MQRSSLPTLGIIMLLALFSLWVVLPYTFSLSLGGWSFRREGMTLGLDLQGGTNLILEADLSKVDPQARANAMEGVRRIIDRRINAYGITEPIIQLQGTNRVSIELPGVKDIQEAKRLIGQTAQLDFREQVTKEDGTQDWIIAKAIGSDGNKKELTGRYFKPNAAVVQDPQTGLPEVSFEFDDEGARLFEQITTHLLEKPLGIFLDNELVSAPRVKAVLSSRGVITGLSLSEARTLAIQLNSGALPVPLTVIKEQDVDATLGSDSIRKSIIAGIIGSAVVLLFMLLYYRLPGLLADVALLIYALLILTIFKLVPVTLTLAGIAGFILSIGMAVDANILIFERTREELRGGRTLGAAIEAGFARAWTSIRDSNVSTFITCLILFWFGSNFGASLVTGFAITLFIGVAVSMFTAIVVTRTFLRLLIGTGVGQWHWLFAA